MMDRLDSERMFLAVMETGSFVAAAARLRTSSGQASKLVSRLESHLGVRLLNRTTRAVSPTEAGYAYLERLADASVDIYPADLREEIDALNECIYPRLNNGVYRAGFATTQVAYEEAFQGAGRARGTSRRWARLPLSRASCLCRASAKP